jgi:hypothetical protein
MPDDTNEPLKWILGVLGGLAGAVILGVLVVLISPLRNRFISWWRAKTRDHGVELVVYTRPDEMADLTSEQLLSGDAAYYTAMDYYIRNDTPPDGPRRGEEWWEWALRNSAEDVYSSHVLLLLQATLDRTIVIRPPQITDFHSAVHSGLICGPEGKGGNGLLVRRFYVDLDEDRPKVRYFDDQNEQQKSATFRMSKGESVGILVIAATRRGRHEWHLDLPIVIDGHKLLLKADDHGAPFVTVGPDKVDAVLWDSDARTWMKSQGDGYSGVAD